jgi:hypothetical protein
MIIHALALNHLNFKAQPRQEFPHHHLHRCKGGNGIPGMHGICDKICGKILGKEETSNFGEREVRRICVYASIVCIFMLFT